MQKLSEGNKLQITAAVKAILSDWMMYHMGLLYNSNQPIVTLEQMAFQRRLYRELKRFADRGVCITLNGQTDVPLQHIANLCIIRQRGMYYAQKEYNADGILTAIHFVLYDRRHRDCVSRVSEPV